MALGNTMMGQQQIPIHPALAQAMAPQAVQAQAQPQGGGLGDVLTRMTQNPAAIQMLLQSGSQLLNPTSFQRPGGRIADAISTGVSGYNQMQQQAEQTEFERGTINRREDRADRGADQADTRLDQSAEQIELQREQLEQRENESLRNFGLSAEQLAAQKKLWEAQMAKYGAEADALRKKAEQGPSVMDLTGPERIINNLSSVLVGNGVPEDKAYTMAFDIYNKSSEGKAKAITGAYESLGMLASTGKGKEMLEQVIEQIDQSFQSGTDILEGVQGEEIAPGVMRSDVEAALTSINQNDGTQLTWDTLNEQQRDRLLEAIRTRKGAQ